jgi:serine/threonine protein kinase/tetratricopeptide (TPR) repeat protein
LTGQSDKKWQSNGSSRSPLSAGVCLGKYKILSQLGAGGMGEVYLAQDTRLERTVALKILPASVADDRQRLQRFIQEAKAASALNHPNILTIYEVEQIDSITFIAAESIEGETLRQRLKLGPLEIAEALAIGVQIASALAVAHTKGIIHRDLKPENIMVRRDGIVKILDFGLAKLTGRVASEQAADTEAATKTLLRTEPGVVMGTAAYMSPEQARGINVDARTDVFSLGIVTYEMICGHTPFPGDTQSDVIAAILKTEPPPLAAPGIPHEMDRIVHRCLKKDREQRYASANAVLDDLKNLRREVEAGAAGGITRTPERGRKLFISRSWLAVMALGILAVTALGYLLLSRGAATPTSPEIKSLAVLPLQNLSGDPEQEYFADGMTETLISNLTQIRALNRVISRTSVMRYKGSPKSLPEIAAELGVDAVIEGTVQRSGGRVRVTAKLIPAATDSAVWTREYERDLSDVLKLQTELARAVAQEIRIQVTPEEKARLAVARNIDPQAHEAFLLGRHHLRTNDEDLRQAIEHFERTIKLAKDYAPAHAALSRAWALRGIWGTTTRQEAMSLAEKAASMALALDSQLSEAHVALSDVKHYKWDWDGAERELIRAIELDPNNADTHRAYADLLMALTRHDQAIREIQRAEQLDPFSSFIQARFARVLYRASRYDEALPHLQRAVELDRHHGNVMPYWIFGSVYTEMGRYDEAIRNFKKAQSQGARPLDISAEIACVYARMGKSNEARKILSELKAKTTESTFSTAPVAYAYAALGEKDAAFEILFRLVEERQNLATHIKADPPLVSLHSDPRWKKLLARMNLQ